MLIQEETVQKLFSDGFLCSETQKTKSGNKNETFQLNVKILQGVKI